MILVHCPKGASVRLPDGAACKKGDVLPCPKSCTLKRSLCAGRDTFSVTAVNIREDGGRILCKEYDEEERARWFPAAAAPAAPAAPASPAAHVPPASRTEPAAPAAPAASAAGGASAEETAKKYRRLFGGGGGAPAPEAPLYVTPERTYTQFSMGGKIFREDAHGRSLPLNAALREVFVYWATPCVFTPSGALRDDFKWLLSKTCARRIRQSEADAVLGNGEYTLSQKFFHLFYDVIYRYDPPAGFYWSDARLEIEPLSARFTDRRDFSARYCENSEQGRRFREFFRLHKAEILQYLGSGSEEGLFEDMTLQLAKQNSLVLLGEDGAEPVFFGTLAQFRRDMLVPSPLAKMQAMIAFLKKYYLGRGTAVTLRTSKTPLMQFTDDADAEEREEDASMYRAARLCSSSRYATEYRCFITLLREYAAVNAPEQIDVGELHFTRANYSAELMRTVSDFCTAHFGEADAETEERLKGRAWLAKSLFERGVLPFPCENAKRIQACFALLSPKNFTIEGYYRTFSSASPEFFFGGRIVTLHEYIGRVIEEKDAFTAASELVHDARVTAWFTVKNAAPAEETERLMEAYRKQYEEFLLV